MKRILLLLSTFLVLVVFSSCAPKGIPAERTFSHELHMQEPKTALKEQWQVGWEKAIKAGQREGKFVAHTAFPPQARTGLAAIFKEKFGIEADLIAVRGAEARAKLFAERRAGLYTVDLYLMGPGPTLIAGKPLGILDPLEPLLILPEVLAPKVWYGGKINWEDEEHYGISYFATPTGQLAFNRSLINPQEIKYWQDLLAPKWKGKISLYDPTTTGPANKWFQMMGKYILGLDYMRQLARQDLIITRNQRLPLEWLAQGKYPITIAASQAIVEEFIRDGVPIEFKTLGEGTYLSAAVGGILLINQAPHPNAAKVFVNWLLSKEGQMRIAHILNAYSSARLDVPMDFLSPEAIRREGVKYMDSRGEKMAMEETGWLEIAREVFGPLLK